jgi:hypothetical protein
MMELFIIISTNLILMALHFNILAYLTKAPYGWYVLSNIMNNHKMYGENQFLNLSVINSAHGTYWIHLFFQLRESVLLKLSNNLYIPIFSQSILQLLCITSSIIINVLTYQWLFQNCSIILAQSRRHVKRLLLLLYK